MALLLPLPLLVRWLLPRNARDSDQPNSETLLHPSLEHLRETYHNRRPRTPISGRIHPLLLALCWLALVAAAMRPQWLEPYRESRTEGYDLMLAVDTSRSMTAEDFSIGGRPISRMAVLKGTMDKFIANRVGDRIGLIIFGDVAYVVSPLTLDRDAVRLQLDDVVPGIAGDSTAMGDSLGLAVKKLRERPPGSRVIVLISDGVNDGGLLQPMDSARLAANEGIRVYTIGVGSTDKEVRLLSPDYRGYESATDLVPDEELLRRVSAITGGAYFRATDAQALEQIYERIDLLEKTRAESRTVMIPRPLYRWPLGAALLCLLLLGLFPEGRLRYPDWLPGRKADA
jgi:Ca-activated chloride channel family protein